MTNDPIREAEDAGKKLVEDWWVAYNALDATGHRALLGFPLASFGGARPGRDNLDVSVQHDPAGWTDERALHRDPGWHHSVILHQQACQTTPEKTHTLTEFSRNREDGTPYGLVKSRLSVGIKRDGQWHIRVLSSGGLRDPEHPDEPTDAELMAKATDVVEQVVAAINDRDVDLLRSLCHFPLVRIAGTELSSLDTPADLTIPDDGVTTTISRIEPLTPQAGDKVVVDIDIRRFSADRRELEPEGAICLVTREAGEHWGLQFSSSRAGLSGLV